jgi:hypothetical protein
MHSLMRQRLIPFPKLHALLVDLGKHMDQKSLSTSPASQGSGHGFDASKQPPPSIVKDHVPIAHRRTRN